MKRFSMIFELPESRLRPGRPKNEVPRTWYVMVEGLRRMWEIGQDTELVPAFVHYFDDNPDPLRRTLW